jgi:hypothetical protein
VFSTPERAILELCDETPDSALVHEVNALMQGLATLRPQLVSALLQHCEASRQSGCSSPSPIGIVTRGSRM